MACCSQDNDSLQLPQADTQVKASEVGHVRSDSCLTLVLNFTATTIKLKVHFDTTLTTLQLGIDCSSRARKIC